MFRVYAALFYGDGGWKMMSRFQYRDPLIGVLDYIAEVCVLMFLRLFRLYLFSSKRNARTTPWQSPRMITFDSSKTLYVQIKIKMQCCIPNEN